MEGESNAGFDFKVPKKPKSRPSSGGADVHTPSSPPPKPSAASTQSAEAPVTNSAKKSSSPAKEPVKKNSVKRESVTNGTGKREAAVLPDDAPLRPEKKKAKAASSPTESEKPKKTPTEVSAGGGGGKKVTQEKEKPKKEVKAPSKEAPKKKRKKETTPTKSNARERSPDKKTPTKKRKRVDEDDDLRLLSAQKKLRPVALSEANFEPLNRWWEREENPTHQWTTLEHRGLLFTPEYEPHGVRMKYKGAYVDIPPEAEEVANFWCQAMDSEWATKAKFRENFWAAFKSKLPSDHPIKDFEGCSFQPIKDHLDELREAKKNMTKEEKLEAKKQKDEIEAPYSYALVDHIREKMGNFRVEPPGLFRGRGEHPKAGMLKKRMFPESVTLNMGPEAPVPKCHVKGHAWKDVLHDQNVTWLADYRDSVNNQTKYVFLSAASGWKGQSDHQKYEKARKLKAYIDGIRRDYTKKLDPKSEYVVRQLGTAVYLIDVLALRVGGEKDTEEEADTVGCCSLRKEHVTCDDETNSITLDFLGKDSIRYLNTVQIDKVAYNNIKAFCKGKRDQDNIFDGITVASLNKYLRDLMPGLSAKVFRTYNASITLQQELGNIHSSIADVSLAVVADIVRFYNDANRQVAILCNHQRAVPKQHETSMANMQKRLDAVNEDIAELQDYIQKIKKKKTVHIKKEEEGERKSMLREGMTVEQAERKIDQVEKRKAGMELQMRMKEDNKTVSLNTSKINYMDPRISVAFCKKYNVPIEKVFNKGLRSKFPWAMYCKSEFVF